MPEDVQSRFTVLDKPTESPGHCVVCGAVDRAVIDFGVDVDWADLGFGRAYFCVTCIKQAASKFPDPILEIARRADISAAVLNAKVELTNAIADVITAFSPSPDVHSNDDLLVVAAEAEHEDSASDSGNDSDANGQLPGTADEASSDDSGEGPPRLPGNRVNEPFVFGFGTDRSE